MQKQSKPSFTTRRNYFLTSLALVLIISWVSFSTKRGPLIELYDYGEHAASIRELSAYPFSPQNPLLTTDGSTTLRYTPYILLLALTKKVFHLNLFTTINLSSIISFLFLVMGVYLWSKEYFRDRNLPLYVLITLLFLWGKPFDYSNEYNLRFMAYTSFYPSTVTFNLSFLGLYFLLNYVRYGKIRSYVSYVLFAVFIVMTHPLTGSFFLLSSFLLVITERERGLKRLGFYLVTLVIIAVCSLLWPYYSFIDAVSKSITTDWYPAFRMYLYDTRNIYRMGPALLGLPIIVLLFMRKKCCFISYGFLLCSLIYVASYIINIRLGERYIFFTIFFLHLSLAWYFSTLELLSFSKIRGVFSHLNEKNVHVLFFTVILALSIFYQGTKLSFEQAGYLINYKPKPIFQKYENPLDTYTLMKNKLRKGDIVMSDPLTSWLIPAFTGAKIVSLYHNNPFVSDNKERVQDATTFYDATTPLTARKEIVKKYGITHVLLNFNRMKENNVNSIYNYCQLFRIDVSLVDDLKMIGKIVFENEGCILFQLSNLL